LQQGDQAHAQALEQGAQPPPPQPAPEPAGAV
jgi:hypothetical protein